MDLRSCSNLHFIQAIRAGFIGKFRNVDTCGMPVLVFKKLEDIYESEDAKKLDNLLTLQSQDRYADMMFDWDKVKTESQCLPVVERKTRKRDVMDDFTCNSDNNEEGSDSDDLNFGKMTLKQLKEQCRTKKRKVLHSVCLSPKQDYTAWQPEEDECDIQEPISSWKSKLSKNLKHKRKHAKKCAASSSHTEVSVKSEQILSAEDSLQSSGYLPAHINVKVEASETEYSEWRNMVCVADDTSIGCSQLLGSCGGASGEIPQAVNPDGEQISFREEYQNCVLNEVSYDYLEHSRPTSLLPSIGGENMEADYLKNTCQEFVVLPVSEDKGERYIDRPFLEESSPETIFPVKDQGSDMCNISHSKSSVHEISLQTSGISEVQVPYMATDNSVCCMELSSTGDPWKFDDGSNENLHPNVEIDSLSSPLRNCSPFWSSNPCSSPEIVLVSADDDQAATEKPAVMSVSADAARNCLSPHKNPIAFECGSTIIEEKLPLRSAPDDAESNSPKRNPHCDIVVHELSVPVTKNYHNLEQCHPPERLLSTRKAISPTSQEKLCHAMKDVELKEEIDHYKCKEKLQFGKETENNASPAGPVNECAEVNKKPEGLREVTTTKGAISPKQIPKRPKNDRKFSPPKGIRRGPHFSRSLPYVTTRATSIQSCSESAIAFSQRQMHDIECLAMKLMQELKSMKDIVEGKLHPDASPATFLDYDADEMTTAIKSATKVEETTRKWLSMMAKDCNRFCRLMRSTEKEVEIASGNAIPKERKISFADEAGGVLCHVKFFEDSSASLDSES